MNEKREPETEGEARRRRRNEAARWHGLLQSPNVSSRAVSAWKRWEADPDNRRVFDEMERLWAKSDRIVRPERPTPDSILTDTYDPSEPIARWQDRLHSPFLKAPARSKRHYWYFGLAATVAFCFIGMALVGLEYWQTLLPGTHVTVFETGVAEHRTVELSDGSTIQLGAKSSVTTNMGAHLRTVVLDRGEALFAVVHDASRPFRVMAGAGTITAVGTAFNVRRLEDHVVVTVTEGTVQITPNSVSDTREISHASPLTTPDQPPQQVTHGQQVTYDQQGRLSPPQFVDHALPVAWRAGRLRFQGERLANVLTDVNRYSRKPVVLGDRAAGELLYSGTVFEGNVDEWIRNLQTIFPTLEVIATDADTVLIRSRPLITQQ